jgi:hypothetical protein
MRLGGDSGQRIPGIDREVVFFRFFDSTKMGELSFIPQGTVGGIRFSWVPMIEIGVFFWLGRGVLPLSPNLNMTCLLTRSRK